MSFTQENAADLYSVGKAKGSLYLGRRSEEKLHVLSKTWVVIIVWPVFPLVAFL